MELLREGFFIMLIGMSTVFAFLVIMIFSMDIISKLLQYLNKYFPEEVIEIKKGKQTKDDDTNIALAIACAIHKKTAE